MADLGANANLSTTRRTLVRGAAWSVPVVSVASTAPAYAASLCSNPSRYYLDWGTSTYSHTSATAGVATINSTNGGPALYASFSSQFFGNGVADGNFNNGQGSEPRNLSVPSGSTIPGNDTNRDPVISSLGGIGPGERGLRLQQASRSGYANRQELTVTFRTGSGTGTPVNVQGLSFYIVDIDALTGPDYSDRVALTPAIPLTAQTRAPGIRGDGVYSTDESDANTGPWRNTNTDLNQGENTDVARVQVNYLGTTSFSSFKLTYWTNTGTGQYHRIFLSDFSFKRCPGA